MSLVAALLTMFGRSDAEIYEAGPYPGEPVAGEPAEWDPVTPTVPQPSPSGATVTKSPSPSASASPTVSATTTPSRTATTTRPAMLRRVTVLNQSTRTGLASQVGRELSREGWTVVSIGNFTGRVPSTTVYYPEGHEASARALARDLPGADRIAPRFTGLARDRLTVVVTSDYGR